MIIRLAKAEDGEALWVVHTQAIRQAGKSHYTPEQIEAWGGRLTPQSYGPKIAKDPFFVAEGEGGEVVGFSAIDMASGEIRAVYVSPNHERRGVGRRLLQTLEDLAWQQGLSELRVDASLNAMAFYECNGFRQQYETTHRIGASGVEIPCVKMVKLLDTSS